MYASIPRFLIGYIPGHVGHLEGSVEGGGDVAEGTGEGVGPAHEAGIG